MTSSLRSAAARVLEFYDGLDRQHDPGEAEILDALAAALRPTPDARAAALEEVGQTERGYTIWRQKVEAHSGHRYWSDSIGGGVVLWDTAIASIEELEFCIAHERALAQEPSHG